MKSFRCAVILLACVVSVLSGCSRQVDVTGVWKGKMIQPEGPRGLDGYGLTLVLHQEDSVVAGISRIDIPGTEYFGLMRVSGALHGDSIYYCEVEMLEERPRPEHFWCLKKGTIRLQAGGDRLEGEWTAENCSPGRILVDRVPQ